MTQAETPVMPLHMRRDRFAPVDELRELREGEGVRRFETPFGANVWIVTRYADVREVLGDAEGAELLGFQVVEQHGLVSTAHLGEQLDVGDDAAKAHECLGE